MSTPEEQALSAKDRLRMRIAQPAPLSARDQLRQKVARHTAEESRKFSVIDNIAGGASRATTQGLGFPVDVVNAGLSLIGFGSNDPFGGSQSFTRGLQRLGLFSPAEEGSTVASAAEVGFGSLIPAMGLTAAGLKLGTKAAPLLREAAEKPGQTAARESSIGAVAGAVGQTAEDMGVPGGRLTGEIGTGLVIGVTRSVVQGLKQATELVTGSLTTEGVSRRVAKKVQGAALDADKAAADIKSSLEEVGSETGLSSPQLSRDVGLLSMERALIRSDGFSKEALARESMVNQFIREQIREFGGEGITEHFINRVRLSTDRLDALLIERLDEAKVRAETTISELPPVAGRAQLSQIVNKELISALDDARKDERMLWRAALGDGGIIDTRPIKDMLKTIKRTSNKADSPIPAEIQSAVKRFDKQKGRGAFTGEAGETIDELQSLRRLVLLKKREIRASDAPDGKLLGKLDDIQQSILDSMEGAGDSELLKEAREFTKSLNDKFTRGAVGKLLGFESSGDSSTVPATLMRKLLQTKEAGGENIKDVVTALGERKGGIEAAEQFIAGEFVDATVKAGSTAIDTRAAARFVKNHAEALDMFPDLRARLANATEAQQLLDDVTNVGKQTKADFLDSRLALFLNMDPMKAVARILSDKNPMEAAKSVMGDIAESPEAVAGFRALFSQHLLKRAQVKRIDPITNTRFLSPAKMRDVIDNHSDVIKTIYGDDGLKRWEKATAIAEQQNLTATTKIQGGSDTMQNMLGGVIGRVIGARIFSALPFVGGEKLQVPAAGARIGKSLLGSMGQDEANELLAFALNDAETMTMLLQKETATSVKALAKILDSKGQLFLLRPTTHEDDE